MPREIYGVKQDETLTIRFIRVARRLNLHSEDIILECQKLTSKKSSNGCS